MEIYRSNFYVRSLQLFFVILFSGALLFLSNEYSILLPIAAMGVLCLGACMIVDFDILHPYCWYSAAFFLYSDAYPILYYLGINKKFGYSKEIMIYQWVALVIFLIVISPKKYIFETRKKDSFAALDSKYVRLFTTIMCFAILFAIALIFRGNFANKKAIYASGNIFLLVSFRIAIVLNMFYIYQLYNTLKNKNKVDFFLMIKVGFPIVFLGMITGERNIMFTFLVVTVLILFFLGKIKKRHMLILVPIGIIMLPLSHMYKYFFLTGNVSKGVVLSPKTMLVEFLEGEFMTGGRNLQILVNNSFTEGYFGGKSIVNDFIRVFVDTGYTHSSWFNDTFFADVKTTGYGFTMVGEGYVNFGLWGIVLVFLILSLLLKYVYWKAERNQYWFAIYIYMIPVYIYSIRADLANIFSPLLIHAVLTIGILKLVEKFQLE